MDEIRKACPFCGASLPEEASFCPCCAQNIRPRRTIKVPTHLRRKVLKLVLGLIVAAAVAAGAYLHLAPATYDGWGEVTYTDDDGTYQLLLSFRNERFTPQPEITEQAEVKGEYRMPSRLFINHVDTGANAAQIFMQKVDTVDAQILQPVPQPHVLAHLVPVDILHHAAGFQVIQERFFQSRPLLLLVDFPLWLRQAPSSFPPPRPDAAPPRPEFQLFQADTRLFRPGPGRCARIRASVPPLS